MTKKIGIVGLGKIAHQVYLPSLLFNSLVEIGGVCSSEKLSRHMEQSYQKLGYALSLQSLIRRDLDAVYIDLPVEKRYAAIKECLLQGLHVYVEPPYSYHINDSLELINLAEKRNLLLFAGFHRRFAPAFRKAKDWFEEAGGFNLCIAQKNGYRLHNQPLKKKLYDELMPLIDAMLWLGNGVQDVISYTKEQDEAGMLQHISGNLIFGRSNGFFSMNCYAGMKCETIEMHGGGRSAIITDVEFGRYYEYREGMNTVQTTAVDQSVLDKRGYSLALEHFLQSIDEPAICEIQNNAVLDAYLIIEKLSK